MTEAPTGVTINLTALKPMPADDEAKRLHQISKCQIVDENDILVQSHKGTIVSAPGDHAIADKGEEAECGDDGNQSKSTNRRKTSIEERRKVGIDAARGSARRFNHPERQRKIDIVNSGGRCEKGQSILTAKGRSPPNFKLEMASQDSTDKS